MAQSKEQKLIAGGNAEDVVRKLVARSEVLAPQESAGIGRETLAAAKLQDSHFRTYAADTIHPRVLADQKKWLARAQRSLSAIENSSFVRRGLQSFIDSGKVGMIAVGSIVAGGGSLLIAPAAISAAAAGGLVALTVGGALWLAAHLTIGTEARQRGIASLKRIGRG